MEHSLSSNYILIKLHLQLKKYSFSLYIWASYYQHEFVFTWKEVEMLTTLYSFSKGLVNLSLVSFISRMSTFRQNLLQEYNKSTKKNIIKGNAWKHDSHTECQQITQNNPNNTCFSVITKMDFLKMLGKNVTWIVSRKDSRIRKQC